MTSTDRHRRAPGVAGLLTAPRLAWLVALVPLVVALAALMTVGEGDRERTSTDALPEGYDSTRGTALLERLPESDSLTAVVLWRAEERLTEGQLADLQEQAGQLSPAGPGLVVAEDGTAAIAVTDVPDTSGSAVSEGVDELREQVRERAPDGVRAQVTGPAAIEADLAAVFDGANTRLLLVTASVVAVLLVITYRSPVLWLVPLAVVGIADRLAAIVATQFMAAVGVAWDESTVGILSVLVFGAGTDYALLLISRYRDELHHEPSRHVAMARALRRTAEAVVSSAATVVLGLLVLVLSLVPTTRGLGVACAVGVVVAAVAVLVVLPAALVLFGRWVFWPRVPRVGEGPARTDTIWHKIGAAVARRPGAVVVAGALVLAAMSAGLFRVDLGLDQAEQFLEEPEAISAAERLSESFPAGTAEPTRIVTTGDAGAVLAAVDGVRGLASARPGESGGGVSTVDVVLTGSSGSEANAAAVEALRDAVSDLPETYVTGVEAEELDAADGTSRDLRLLLPLILAVVLVGLGLLLRSVVAPLLLVATVVATYAAAMGLSWWLFTGPLGFTALDDTVPIFAFLFLVALGVDYNIFLVARAREEAAEHGTRDGMLRALAATGGVITSAGILLAAVFLVLGVLPLVVLAQVGTVICIGVLLDTLLVRTVVVPALALRLGDRFWWPRRVGRRSATAATAPVNG